MLVIPVSCSSRCQVYFQANAFAPAALEIVSRASQQVNVPGTQETFILSSLYADYRWTAMLSLRLNPEMAYYRHWIAIRHLSRGATLRDSLRMNDRPINL